MTGDAQRYYILAPEAPVPEHTHVLKHDETFGLFNDFGDIDAHARNEEGLYHEGTRHLSRLTLELLGRRPLLLSSAVRRDNLLLSADLTNPDVYLDGNVVLARGSLHIYRTKIVRDGCCHERIHVRNFTRSPVEIALGIGYAADYVDIFEIRGQRRARRGELLEPQLAAAAAELGYVGLDGVTRRTLVRCDPAPERVTPEGMQFLLHLEARGERVFEIAVRCSHDASADASTDASALPARSYEATLEHAERVSRESPHLACNVETSNDQFDAWVERSAADLGMLLSRTGQGLYPYAGVPWFDTTFGRDGIITALQCLWLAPHVARGVLAFLAATQARSSDTEHDAEPGKILHEARRGEMAALGEIPFGRYYGGVDTTALFVMLAGAYWRRTADAAFIESIWPSVRAALAWIEGPGDADGDGFIEYRRRAASGLVQQGWKDSHDSVFHADGRLAEGPIALCEVQGYAYAARLEAAGLAERLGDAPLARRLHDAARALRERFQQRFWCAEIGTYALALDGEKRPCRVRSSNPGHCLFAGIAADEHARAIMEGFAQERFFSGWGVRTIADCECGYNPMAYHNGSVWPHDNALIALGAARYGAKALAARILTAQLEASTFFESSRLPELFCGFRRREGKAPTRYPVACSPQAWAAGAVFMMLEACLGLAIDAERSRITFRHPHLPPALERVCIRDLRADAGSVDVVLQRSMGSVSLSVARRSGDVEVVMVS